MGPRGTDHLAHLSSPLYFPFCCIPLQMMQKAGKGRLFCPGQAASQALLQMDLKKQTTLAKRKKVKCPPASFQQRLSLMGCQGLNNKQEIQIRTQMNRFCCKASPRHSRASGGHCNITSWKRHVFFQILNIIHGGQRNTCHVNSVLRACNCHATGARKRKLVACRIGSDAPEDSVQGFLAGRWSLPCCTEIL